MFLCGLWVMVFNTTFNNISVISWQSALLVEETGVPKENYRPVTSHWQTLAWAGFNLTTLVVIGTDFIVTCKSNYHTVTTIQSRRPLVLIVGVLMGLSGLYILSHWFYYCWCINGFKWIVHTFSLILLLFVIDMLNRCLWCSYQWKS